MNKLAIVLGGGGARGPYQIGVWQALRKLGISYSIVTGSSVGALNGALMVQGDYDTARDLWLHLTLRDVVSEAPDFSTPRPQELLDFMRQTVGQRGMDISPLEAQMRRVVDEQKIRESPIEYGLVTTELPLLRPVQLRKDEIPQGELIDYMLASASWFPFFQRRNIDGRQYIDGAYSDNLPAELAVRCGATAIIAVDLQGAGIVHTFRRDIPVRYIRSHWNLGDMLLFGEETATRSMRLGYQDGLRAFHRLEGRAYAFPPGDTARNIRQLRPALERIQRRTGVSLLAQRDRLPRLQEMLRYRSIDRRFLHRRAAPCTLGCAVTTAGEITGELLQIAPDRIYRMREFNKHLLRSAAQLQEQPPGEKGHDLVGARSRTALLRLYRMLRDGCIRGRAPSPAFWRLAAISPVEYVAANYLLALELLYRRPG